LPLNSTKLDPQWIAGGKFFFCFFLFF
jgi:hypothetical protein